MRRTSGTGGVERTREREEPASSRPRVDALVDVISEVAAVLLLRSVDRCGDEAALTP